MSEHVHTPLRLNTGNAAHNESQRPALPIGQSDTKKTMENMQ